MAHLPRFRRAKKELPASPPLITNGLPGPSASTSNNSADPNSKITPPPGDLPLPVPESPLRPFGGKLSPFTRVFHRSQKRARDSPPASLPHSPLAAAVPISSLADGRPVSPLSLKMDTSGLPTGAGENNGETGGQQQQGQQLLQVPREGQGQQPRKKSSLSSFLQVPRRVKMPGFLES
ncbi:hypothetical protein QBC36DRAFT_287623, partial [Triangularia setosa]